MNSKGAHTLAEYVRSVRGEKRFSLVDVARQSGGQISDGYVSLIENGQVLNVTPKKLIALARGLRVTEEELFAIARGQSLETPTAVEAKVLTLFRELPEDRRGDIMRILQALHREHGVKQEPEIARIDKKRKPSRAA